MIRGSSRTSACSEPSGIRRHAWLAALLLYGAAATGDFAYHLIDHLHTGNRAIGYPEIVVGFCGSLFWPVDLIAMALLPPG
jgi:hypothetical protein